MKKIVVMFVITSMIFSMVACGNKKSTNENKRVNIVATIFPEYDWVKSVAGDTKNVETTLLIDKGVDLHSYQPTADDVLKISTCDVFIYVGGESDEWVEDALKEAENKDIKTINLMEVLGNKVREEKAVEGMQEEHEEHEVERENDEHVWLSLKNAKLFVNKISETLQEVDENNKETYKNNAEKYIEKLDKLDKEYTQTVQNSKKDTVLFGDRFPFRYLMDDYGIKYYAAFDGCSAETEASFETISFLAKKCDELKLKVILKETGSNDEIAKTIRENTKTKDQKILSMNAMQNVTFKDITKGTNYLSLMSENRDTLEKALK